MLSFTTYNKLNKLNKLVILHFQKKILKSKVISMIKHINDNIYDNELKNKKICKINRFYNHLMVIKENYYNLNLQYIALIWLYARWSKLVLENGFVSILDTINNIQLPELLDWKILTNDRDHYCLVDCNHFISNYVSLVTPIHCNFTKCENKDCTIKLYDIKPPLTDLVGKKNGLILEIQQPKYTLKMFGLLDDDSLRIHRSIVNLDKLRDELSNLENDEFVHHVNCITFRDIVTLDSRRIVSKIKNQKEKINFYKNIESSVILSEYGFLPDIQRVELITLLLEFGLIEKARDLYGKIPFSKNLLDCHYRGYLDNIRFKKQSINNDDDVPYEIQIDKLNCSDKIKKKAYDKLKTINKSNDGDSKAQKYLDGLLKIPFGKIRHEKDLSNDSVKEILVPLVSKLDMEIGNSDLVDQLKTYLKKDYINNSKLIHILNSIMNHEDYSNFNNKNIIEEMKKISQEAINKQLSYIDKVDHILSKHIHGHEPVKLQIKRLIAKWISGGQSGIILGLEGPPGNGKTTLIKKGLANCLLDDKDVPRPVGFVPLGGSCNSSSLVGHGYTYQGSTWGRIVDILMDCKCMNPILLFDELDKVSKSEHGKEVSSILIHLTDTTQNDEFYDKYFEGVPLDLSKALMIFTFNDRSLIDPILLDRMTIIKTEPLRLKDKLIVADNHIIPELLETVNIDKSDINVDSGTIENIIHTYTREAGARQLKRLLEEIISELNLRKLMNPTLRLDISNEIVKDVFKERDTIIDELVPKCTSLIGQINGLYANALGLGGILPIQVSKLYEDSKLELTGTQGDTMKESMKCAKTVAYELFRQWKVNNSEYSNNELDTNNSNEKKEELDFKSGIHIHCPSTSIPKDGPSAGSGITLAIYSYLTNLPIDTRVAITGEIDLKGKVMKIGGLEAKINGAKKAGAKLVIIPEENKEQYDRLVNNNLIPAQDETFRIVLVDHIEQCLNLVIFS